MKHTILTCRYTPTGAGFFDSLEDALEGLDAVADATQPEDLPLRVVPVIDGAGDPSGWD